MIKNSRHNSRNSEIYSTRKYSAFVEKDTRKGSPRALISLMEHTDSNTAETITYR